MIGVQSLSTHGFSLLGTTQKKGCMEVSGKRCKDYFAADVGHVCRRDSVVGSRSWVSGWLGEGRRRPRSAVGDEEREREMRQAQNRTE